MVKLSVAIIAKNEEEVIEKALESVSFSDEIVVIDGGSTDKTAQIAKKNNAKVFSFISSDFSASRNYALKQVTGEWILYIDADERVSKELKEAILAAIEKGNNDIAAYRVKRQNYYLGNYRWPKIEKMERLFRKTKLKKWHGVLHESPEVEGKIIQLNDLLLHYNHRNITYMLTKTILWSNSEAKLRYDTAHPKMAWWRFPRVMIPTFFDWYVKQGGFRLGTAGLIESMYQMFSIFVTYAKLWELQNNDQKK